MKGNDADDPERPPDSRKAALVGPPCSTNQLRWTIQSGTPYSTDTTLASAYPVKERFVDAEALPHPRGNAKASPPINADIKIRRITFIPLGNHHVCRQHPSDLGVQLVTHLLPGKPSVGTPCQSHFSRTKIVLS